MSQQRSASRFGLRAPPVFNLKWPEIIAVDQTYAGGGRKVGIMWLRFLGGAKIRERS